MAFLILLCLAYSINAADRQIFPTLLPAIRQAFGYDLQGRRIAVDHLHAGTGAGGPSHRLRRGPRLAQDGHPGRHGRCIAVFTATATIYANGFWDMLFHRAMTGVGEGMQMAALFAASRQLFPPGSRSFFIGWLIVAYGVGASSGAAWAPTLAQAADSWHNAVRMVRLHRPGDRRDRAGAGAAGFHREPRSGSERAGRPGGAGRHAGGLVEPQRRHGRRRSASSWATRSTASSACTRPISGKDCNFSPADAAAAFSFFGLGGLTSFCGRLVRGPLPATLRRRGHRLRAARRRRLRHVQLVDLAAVAIHPVLPDRGATPAASSSSTCFRCCNAVFSRTWSAVRRASS